MAFKNISLSLEAYDALKRLQRQGESFSKIVLRLARKDDISDVFGILSDSEAGAWKRGVTSVRRKTRVRTWH
ncbi:MAG: antitoxin VapB family protein [Candidatus Micrarchaeota archaeon]